MFTDIGKVTFIPMKSILDKNKTEIEKLFKNTVSFDFHEHMTALLLLHIDFNTMSTIINSKIIRNYMQPKPLRSEMVDDIICFNTLVKNTNIRLPSKSNTTVPISGSTSTSVYDTVLMAYAFKSIDDSNGDGDGCECDGGGCDGVDCGGC